MEQGHGDFVINPTGATHDAFCIASTVFVGKLDGPLHYASDEIVFNLANNPMQGEVVKVRPKVPADIVVPLGDQRPTTTLIAGFSRKVLWEYGSERTNGRVTKLQLLPRTQLPRHQLTGMTHWFVWVVSSISTGNGTEPACSWSSSRGVSWTSGLRSERSFWRGPRRSPTATETTAQTSMASDGGARPPGWSMAPRG